MISRGSTSTIDLSGPLVYRDYGGEGLPPAVLIHGIGGAGINWMLLAPLLTAKFHVMALDLPGFGESPLAGRVAALDAQSDLVARFVEEVAGGPTLLIGHSMGGMITMIVSSKRPDLVAHAVLFDPAFPPTTSPAPGLPGRALDVMSSAPALAGAFGRGLVRLRGAKTMVQESFRQTCVDAAALPPDFVTAHIAAEAARMRVPCAYVGYMQAWRWFRDHFSKPADLETMIQAITVPTLLLHGDQDQVVLPSAARRLAKIQPTWTTYFMGGVGHNPNFEAPDASAWAILGWLDGDGARP
ncbi:MAG TPA: alpha/beta hydrolase [Candidatus Dormibacteraeota bacterium]|nr:alpha/beta hydrolase [Candidatus Dormibacteraeota bacterium]